MTQLTTTLIRNRPLPSRPRRRGWAALIALAGVAAGAATLISSMPAAATGNGIDPLVTPVVEPISGTAVADWKLAGRGNPSGVQIAPDWVMTSRHGRLAVGGTFSNQYGSATVDRVVNCPDNPCDISLAHITTALPAPGFPDLVQDGYGATTTSQLAGNVLLAGWGGSRFRVGWARPQTQVGYDTMYSPAMSIGGDSGGPGFYYRPGSTQGHLLGLMVFAGIGAQGLQLLDGVHVRPFLDQTLPAGTVRWTSVAQLGPEQVVPSAVSTPSASATETSVTLSWSAPAAGTSPITDYRAVLIRKDDTTDRRTVVTTGTSATFTGLPANVGYWAFVLPRSAVGEAAVPYVSLAWDYLNAPYTYPYTFTTTVAAGPVAGKVTNLHTTTRKNQLQVSWTRAAGAVAGVNKTDVFVFGCPPNDSCQVLTHTTTSSNSVLVNVPASLTTYGQRFLLMARDSNLTGSAGWARGYGYYLPLEAPLPALDAQVEQRADGQLTFSLHDRADDPALALQPLKGYRPHAKPVYYSISVVDPATGADVPVSYVFPATQLPVTMPWTDLGLPVGTYAFHITAVNGMWGTSTVTLRANIGDLPEVAQTVTAPAPPQLPSGLTDTGGLHAGGAGTLSWTEAAAAAGQATPDGYIALIRPVGSPSAVPVIYEATAAQKSISYDLPAGSYTVTLYAVSQAAGSSLPATA